MGYARSWAQSAFLLQLTAPMLSNESFGLNISAFSVRDMPTSVFVDDD